MECTEPMFRARIVAGGDEDGVERVWPLTPYEVEIIIDDALRAGREARLELVLPAGLAGDRLRATSRRFQRLAARGVRVQLLEDTELL